MPAHSSPTWRDVPRRGVTWCDVPSRQRGEQLESEWSIRGGRNESRADRPQLRFAASSGQHMEGALLPGECAALCSGVPGELVRSFDQPGKWIASALPTIRPEPRHSLLSLGNSESTTWSTYGCTPGIFKSIRYTLLLAVMKSDLSSAPPQFRFATSSGIKIVAICLPAGEKIHTPPGPAPYRFPA